MLRPSSPPNAKASTERPSHSLASQPYTETIHIWLKQKNNNIYPSINRYTPTDSLFKEHNNRDIKQQAYLTACLIAYIYISFPITTYQSLTTQTRSQTNHGGDERDRTADPLLAKQVLSQLSYAPSWWDHQWWAREDLNLRPHAYQACALTN